MVEEQLLTLANMIDPEPIESLAMAYFSSQVLFVATELGLFTQLHGQSKTVVEVATALGLSERSAELLLNACVSLQLLEKQGGCYANTPVSDVYLVKGKTGYQGPYISLMQHYYKLWGSLKLALLQNGSLRSEFDDYVAQDIDWARKFIEAMHCGAELVAPFLVETLDLSSHKLLLDIGGGSGINAISFVKKFNQLKAIVLDLSSVSEVTKEYVARSGVADRISVMSGDYRYVELPPGVDAVLLSQVLHAEGPSVCRNILARAFAGLVPGGLVIVRDIFPNDDKLGPPAAVLHGLHWLMVTPEGNCYSKAEVIGFLQDVGFQDIQVLALPEPAHYLKVIIARKPLISTTQPD